ncbi:MAG TPA: hypothetical protein VFN40_07210 [Gemmatimonadales bacterium]|jgi:hypothetical protein|nr:hypothetical protein [Gemmatimonadales bacterium]
MRILKQSPALVALGSLLMVVPAVAQQAGTSPFKWYVGGHGGVTSFRTNAGGRELMPIAGGHILITAKRTGLLLSVDQGFGSDEPTQTLYEIRDADNATVQSGVMDWTFQGIRRYSAVLMAYPIRNANIQPFVGVGGGIAHTTGNSAGPFADGSIESNLSSTGFGTAVAGLEFRVGPLSAFGQYQITTKQGFKRVDTVLQADAGGNPVFTRLDYGEWTMGAFHTITGGLRFSLGRARENGGSGGY